MTLTLYTNPQSRGRTARWMLEEVGAPYQTTMLDYGAPMKSAEFLAINPMGKVPAIVHDGTVVTEVAAICAYLADAFPEAGLAPTGAARGAYYRWLFFTAGPLEAAWTARSLNIEPSADHAKTVGYGSFDLAVGALEKAVEGRDYIAGDRFSAADLYVGSNLAFGMMFGIIPKLPVFEAYIGRLMQRDAFQRASALDDAAAQPAG
ncbi:glutathione S-transferase family protein [Acuticoccus sp. MNP-M23]|uniref:glutathione S-transferase family protein n=1 Tax=Acuticoccus sp. MNP-M23 TaxID=3072793 RepID=UPI002816932D|nr:glutathione S-transferase family protein [Acuticoccus sp. MNP-M23]WMS41313.1 glutathione S-transferase family protein [Acuticoccus sp. MNP-M23]